MLKNRVIPVLLIKDRRLVKTTRFTDPTYVGDPLNSIRIFNDKQVDEIFIIDISASKNAREPDFALIENCASECFMPLGYGGGIKNLEHARKILSCGVEKISIQSKALVNLDIVNELAGAFGSQAIVASVDVKKDWLGKYRVFDALERRFLNKPLRRHIEDLVNAGAGEILLNCVDKDGTLSGPDLALVRNATDKLEVPLISLGGVSSLDDIRELVVAGADAVGAGAFFVFHGPLKAVLITYPAYEELEKLFD